MTDHISAYTRQVLVGLAQLLADNDIGVYKPAGYATSDVGIVFGAWPKTPATAIKLNAYDEVIRAGMVTDLYVQVATRVSKSYLDALDATDQLRDLLHRRSHFPLGDVTIGLCVRTSLMDLGRDTTNDLYEHTSNFRLTGLRWLQPIHTPQGD